MTNLQKKGPLAAIWSATTRQLRLTVIWMSTLGSALLVVGTFGDILGWFSSYPFLTNIVSGVTSALFGIPVALVFLQWLNSKQSEELRKRSVERLRHQLSADFFDDVGSIIIRRETADTGELISLYQKLLDDLEYIRDTLRGIKRYQNNSPEWTRPISEEQSRRVKDALVDFKRDLVATSRLAKRILSADHVTWRTRVEARWETLEKSVRYESIQAGLAWLDPELQARVEALMAELDVATLYVFYDVTESVDRLDRALNSPWTLDVVSQLEYTLFSVVGMFAPGPPMREMHVLMRLVDSSKEVQVALSRE